jgi:hypothetical protein
MALVFTAPSVRVSIDRAYLPAGAGDSAPVAHLTVRGAKEVEVSLYEVGHPAQTLLGLSPPKADVPVGSPPLEASVASLRRRAREGYAAIWRSLKDPAREAAKDVLGLDKPIGASLLAPPAAPESRVRRGQGLLRSWRVPTGEAGWNYADVDLGLVPVGLYRVEAFAQDVSAVALLTVSRLSLLAFRTPEGSSILATDSVNGRPLPGVELLARSGTLGKTGPAGLWFSRTSLEGQVVGRFEGQLARLVLSPPRTEAAERTTAAIFFDRRAYKPGEAVHVWSLLRSREAGAWKIPEANEAELQLLDRRGAVLFDEPAEVSALGVVSTDLELPDGLPAGWYSVVVAWGGERRAGEILVQSQAPAEIATRWEAPQWSPPSAPLDVSAVVTDRLGQPEPGVAVHWTAEARAAGSANEVSSGPSEIIGQGAGVTREDGRVPLRLPPAAGEGVVALHAEAEDSAGRSAVADFELRRIQVPALLELIPEHRVLKPGHPSSLAVEAHTLDGQPWHGGVDVHVLGVHSSAGGEAVRTELLEKVVELDTHGRGSVSLPAASPGYLEVRASIPDSGEPLSRASIFVTDNGGDIPTTPDRLELVLDRHDYARGDELRLLVLTPFESGTVLVGLEPSGGPAEELVAVHGYSGVVHLKLPAAAAAARLTAAALVGGTLYRASAPVPLPERLPSLALHLSTDRPLHAGQRTVLALGATDADGHGVPAVLDVTASSTPPSAPSLGQLFLPLPPVAAALFSSSGADDSASVSHAGPVTARTLQPFGPSQLGEVAWEREVAASQTGSLSADDLGHAAWAIHAPAEGEKVYLTARGVGGPDLFGERSWVLPVEPTARVMLDAPRWVRAGDQFETHAMAQAAGEVGCALTLEATGGALGVEGCTDAAGRTVRVSAGSGPVLELSAGLPAQKLLAHRNVKVASLAPGPGPATAGELVRELVEGLVGSVQSADPVELDCAVVRALGALRLVDPNGPGKPSGRDVAAAVARLAGEQNPAGGFGGPDGELRRDLAALRGLVGLRQAGTVLDAGLLLRLQQRVGALVERVDDSDEREVFGAMLATLGEAIEHRRARRLSVGDATDVAEGDAEQIANWMAGHRPNAAGQKALAVRLAAIVAEAGPLDAAEIAASLAALSPRQRVELAVGPQVVKRRYRRIERQPWTEAMLAADEEPAEPTLHPVEGSIPVGSELEVGLTASLTPGTRFACLRDFPPAGLAPLGSPDVSQDGLLLCGPASHDRLEVTYQLRALRPGHFQAPQAGLGVVARPGAPAWVEVAP